MITTHVLLLLALTLGGMFIAYRFKITAIYLVLVIMLIGGAAAVWVNGVDAAPSDLCLTHTNDTSLYYPCTIDQPACWGETWEDNCTNLNLTECESIGGCEWGGTCTGTPTWDCYEVGVLWREDTCEDFIGCRWADFTPAECDSVNITNNYDVCEAEGLTVSGSDGEAWAWVFILFALVLLGNFLAAYLPTKRTKDLLKLPS